MSCILQILYHTIFRTKNSAKTFPLSDCDELYRYVWGTIKNKNAYFPLVESLPEISGVRRMGGRICRLDILLAR